eukprot:scaffold160_cov333-Pavlova_lutheri.AAC.11
MRGTQGTVQEFVLAGKEVHIMSIPVVHCMQRIRATRLRVKTLHRSSPFYRSSTERIALAHRCSLAPSRRTVFAVQWPIREGLRSNSLNCGFAGLSCMGRQNFALPAQTWVCAVHDTATLDYISMVSKPKNGPKANQCVFDFISKEEPPNIQS